MTVVMGLIGLQKNPRRRAASQGRCHRPGDVRKGVHKSDSGSEEGKRGGIKIKIRISQRGQGLRLQ